MKWKEIPNISLTNHDHKCVAQSFLKFYKKQTKSENRKICYDIMIS